MEYKINTAIRGIDYHMVELQERQQSSLFLGCKQIKNSMVYRIEDNLLNRILLGLTRFDSNDLDELIVDPPGHLFQYQINDIEKLRRLRASLNANTMGLGKTIETVTLLKALDGPVLILCPKTVVPHWMAELEANGINAEAFPKKFPFRTTNVYVTNYEQMLNEKLQTTARSSIWEAIVLDEAHKIKNRKSKISQVVASLPTTRKYALTGTPVLNKPDDLWNILNWLNWRYSGKSYWNFVEYFCELEDGFFGRAIKGLTKDPERQMLLNTLLECVGVRNPSIQIAAGKTVTRVPLVMDKQQKKLYDNLRELVFEELPSDLVIANGMVLMLRMMQATSNPRVVDEERMGKEVGIKFEWIADFLDSNSDKRVVVFSRFAETVKALKEYLEKKKIQCAMIIGAVKSEDRVAEKERFIKGAARVLLGTIGAMGQGLDGLQKVCSTVVFVERDWSPALQEQAEARLLRQGQERLVEVYYLECKDTVDMYVGKINVKKTEDIRRALGDENSGV